MDSVFWTPKDSKLAIITVWWTAYFIAIAFQLRFMVETLVS